MAQQSRAIVIGGGIGGLTAAAALHLRGLRVTVLERAPSLEPVGAAISLAPNALRALDVIGIGHALRDLAAWQGDGGLRTPADAGSPGPAQLPRPSASADRSSCCPGPPSSTAWPPCCRRTPSARPPPLASPTPATRTARPGSPPPTETLRQNWSWPPTASTPAYDGHCSRTIRGPSTPDSPPGAS
ncbi:NAD(P)-binding protein [Streptomyces cynarae]|uniref:NAD(P)-binding protein n=1 Tax=Streptomyces cynarae TaxID=2981134 RepID=A0ABY6DW28_9ACTN|nr:NAD(P)-binding protein [Streptomyces cynarae]UXY18555.1 NAD(P)-binding protein [Streptomyces cynarae]